MHPPPVAGDGVDFAVVCDEAEGLRHAPRGRGVGAEALVEDGERRFVRRILQVGKALGEVGGAYERLVHERAVAQ